MQVDGSPYGGQAYCEVFPRGQDPSGPLLNGTQFLAQVGQASNIQVNYDDIFQVGQGICERDC